MPSLAHEVVASVIEVMARRRISHDEAGMRDEQLQYALRPPHFAPPKSLDRHVTLSVSRRRGWRVYEMTPKDGQRPEQHIVYFHGGGYVREIEPAHWSVCRRMTSLVPARVTVPIYPLAPDHTAAEIVPTAIDIVAEVLAAAGSDANVTLMGDSAGGGMALAVAQGLRDRGLGAPRLILIAPWLDVSVTDPQIDPEVTRDPMLSVPRLLRAGVLYADELSVTDPLVSPIYGELRGLGPITVFVGTRDLLLHDARRLRDLATAQGVSVDYHEHEGLIHVFPILPLPEARWARRVMVTSITGKEPPPRGLFRLIPSNPEGGTPARWARVRLGGWRRASSDPASLPTAPDDASTLAG